MQRRRAGLVPLGLMVLCVGAAMVAAPTPSHAQLPGAVSRPETSATHDTFDIVAEPGSPRQSVEAFLTLTRRGDYAAATRYLVLRTDEEIARGPELAERLKAVLDRRLWVDLERLSPLTVGDTTDGLARNREQLGFIPRRDGRYDPVRLVRVADSVATWWAFSSVTVRSIDRWYGELEGRWIRDRVPPALRRLGPFSLEWWQWLALLVAIPLVVGLGAILERLVRALLANLVRRTRATWDDELLPLLRAPIVLACTTVFVVPLTRPLGLNAEVNGFLVSLAKALLIIAFFWALLRAVTAAEQRGIRTTWITGRPEARALIPLAARVGRVLLLALAAITVLAQFGFPVATFLAGLGIGGIAVALAAQKTLENFFGSVTIGMDKPFHVGDFIKVEDVVGTVETIGLRSTRIRTLDRTLITYPNGRLADMRIETFAARDRIRFATVIGLAHETTPAQLRDVLQGITAWFRANEKVWQDSVMVRFTGFSVQSLEIEIMVWFLTADYNEFGELRQQALFAIMDIVAQAGTGLAVPIRTIRVTQDGPPATDAERKPGAAAPGALPTSRT